MKPDHFDKSSKPLREMFDRGDKPEPARGGKDFEPGRPHPVGDTNPAGVDPLVERNNASVSAYTQPKAGSVGVGIDPTYRVAPPDTTGDLGPNHYVQWVNLRYAVYDVVRDTSGQIAAFNLKAGFPKNGNTIWQGFGGPCETMNDGDPIVQYDQLADRWVLTQFAVSATPYTQCVAVSTGADPTGSYYRYSYSFGKDFNDFPKMGVWPDGYYITYNMFRGGRTFSGSNVCAFERAKMLLGQTARQVCVKTTAASSIQPADLEGTTPPVGTANPMLTIGTSSLGAMRYSVNWVTGVGTLTGPTTVPGVAAFSRACGGGACIPQLGTTQLLDSLGDRLNYRLSYRNFGTHEAMTINHPVATGGVSAIRWYELRNAAGQSLSTAAPVVHQQGTYSPSPAAHRWMGSAALDKTGGIAIGYNISSSTTRPGIRYTGRGPSDPLGALGSESFVMDGGGSQMTTLARWGDYSTISVDPVDGCTMVFTTEFIPANGTYNWSTYIYSFKLSTCQ
jgi:hypothetical protein